MDTRELKESLKYVTSAVIGLMDDTCSFDLDTKDKLRDILRNLEEEKNPELLIRYHREMHPSLPDVVKYGNFIDLYSAETVTLKAGESTTIDLGVSVQCPEGYWMQMVPRSSTFKKYHILQTNSFGVIDTEYCGDNDILRLPVYATEDTVIPANERVCQFRLVKDIPFDITQVEKLENADRGGYGSTGRK